MQDPQGNEGFARWLGSHFGCSRRPNFGRCARGLAQGENHFADAAATTHEVDPRAPLRAAATTPPRRPREAVRGKPASRLPADVYIIVTPPFMTLKQLHRFKPKTTG